MENFTTVKKIFIGIYGFYVTPSGHLCAGSFAT